MLSKPLLAPFTIVSSLAANTGVYMCNMAHFLFLSLKMNVSALTPFSVLQLIHCDLLDCVLDEVLTDLLLPQEATYWPCFPLLVHD